MEATMENAQSPPKKTKIIEALCPSCKKQFQKERALKSFSKCSQMKDFVRRYESVKQVVGLLLVKKNSFDGLTTDEEEQLRKGKLILENPAAIERYRQIEEKRKLNAAKNKKEKTTSKKRSLLERAALDDVLVVPPASKVVSEIMTEEEDEEEVEKSELSL
jgi:hypothetical protein